jgi:hypothetical protein
VTADFRAIHHHSLDLVSEPESWIEAHVKVAEKWDGRMPGVGWAPGSWKERARRAEAEHEAALVKAYANGLEADARVLQLERALTEARESISWRITAPLRRLRLLRVPRRGRRGTLVRDLPSPRAAGGAGGATE